MVACQLNMSSPVGPAEQFAGGSFPRSVNSFVIRFSAMREDEQHSTNCSSLGPSLEPGANFIPHTARQYVCPTSPLLCTPQPLVLHRQLLDAAPGVHRLRTSRHLHPLELIRQLQGFGLCLAPISTCHGSTALAIFGEASHFGSCQHLEKLPTFLLGIWSDCAHASWQPPQPSLHCCVPPRLSSPHPINRKKPPRAPEAPCPPSAASSLHEHLGNRRQGLDATKKNQKSIEDHRRSKSELLFSFFSSFSATPRSSAARFAVASPAERRSFRASRRQSVTSRDAFSSHVASSAARSAATRSATAVSTCALALAMLFSELPSQDRSSFWPCLAHFQVHTAAVLGLLVSGLSTFGSLETKSCTSHTRTPECWHPPACSALFRLPDESKSLAFSSLPPPECVAPLTKTLRSSSSPRQSWWPSSRGCGPVRTPSSLQHPQAGLQKLYQNCIKIVTPAFKFTMRSKASFSWCSSSCKRSPQTASNKAPAGLEASRSELSAPWQLMERLRETSRLDVIIFFYIFLHSTLSSSSFFFAVLFFCNFSRSEP